MRHGSVASRLPQVEHGETARAQASSASASGSISVSGRLSIASAARWAERGPSPGSRASSLTTRSIWSVAIRTAA
jgi:hypothetical protein